MLDPDATIGNVAGAHTPEAAACGVQHRLGSHATLARLNFPHVAVVS